MDIKKKRLIIRCVKIAVVVLISVLMLGLLSPVYFVIIRSFSPAEELFPLKVFPSKLTVGNFADLFVGTGELGVPYSRNLFSSLIITAVTVALQIPIVCAAAYVLAKVKAPGVRAFNKIIEWTIILSPLTLYAPQYILMLKAGLSDSIFAMILPFIVSPLAVYLVRQYMSSVPNEIVYSARIDGASHFRICFSIIMPMVKPALAAAAVLTVGYMWSFSGELFVRSGDIKPLGAFMSVFAAEENSAGMLCALCAVIVVPIIALAVVFRKEIAQTAAFAGLKSEQTETEKE